MACYSPIRAFIGRPRVGGKMNVVFTREASHSGREVSLPCGQCIGCRLQRSRDWAFRCMAESQQYVENCFLTLTLDDAHVFEDGSLDVRVFQLFMKRLRKHFAPRRIRFFHCGEYGEQFGRPHYHALLFNCGFDDKVLFSKRNGRSVFTSKTLDSLWGLGLAVVGDVTFESAAYVARYIVKKVTGDRSEEYYGGRVPEYSTMSRRPGIGRSWFDKYRGDVYPSDEVIVKGRSYKPPRFFDNILDDEDPDMLTAVKLERSKLKPRLVAIVKAGRVVGYESESDDYRLRVKEQVKLASILSLKRRVE